MRLDHCDIGLGYNRTILLIWPNEHNPEVEHGKKKALAMAGKISSKTPTVAENEVVAYLLRAVGSDRIPKADVAKILLQAACRWKDLELLKKVVRGTGATQQVQLLSVDGVVDAFEAFEISRIQAMWVNLPIVCLVLGC